MSDYSTARSARIKTASDWAGLFSIPRTLDSYTSRYSSTSTPPSARRSYEPSYSSYSSIYANRSIDAIRRPFTSRFLRHSEPREENRNKAESQNANPVLPEDSKPIQGENSEGRKKRRRYHNYPTVLNNGSVIRIRHEVSSSEEEETSESEPEIQPEPEIVPEPEPTPEPEDPLDKEERELTSQLMLSLTLTLVDEENIRQRLLEIRKSKLRRNQQIVESSLVQKFTNDADVTLFENQISTAKQEEEKNLTQRLNDANSGLTEVEQKDIQVRLQELFRDRRIVLETCLKNIESTYEHILQETSTELNELESSIRNKNEMVEKLQDEMLAMTVRKEMMSKAMHKINESHQEKITSITMAMAEIDEKTSQYAVLVPAPHLGQGQQKSSKLSDIEPSEELREIERELECPVCMEMARPPIYQCEEGHIICASCKPLLTNCPHNCGKKYSEPAIRCRFAEKLADKYSAQLAKHFGNK